MPRIKNLGRLEYRSENSIYPKNGSSLCFIHLYFDERFVVLPESADGGRLLLSSWGWAEHARENYFSERLLRSSVSLKKALPLPVWAMLKRFAEAELGSRILINADAKNNMIHLQFKTKEAIVRPSDWIESIVKEMTKWLKDASGASVMMAHPRA